MLCVVLTDPGLCLHVQQADLVELRLDLFSEIGSDSIKKIQAQLNLPVVFTLRSQNQGGKFIGSEEQRMAILRSLADLKPAYIDLEYGISQEYVQWLKKTYPEIKIILSYHDFQKTPEDLSALLSEMKRIPADIYKIAAMAHSAIDALLLLECCGPQVAAMAMGEWGGMTRILAPLFASPLTYASLDDQHASAPGQISAATLVNLYRFRDLKPSTMIYALIGDPVDKSIGHLTHNPVMQTLGMDAVYVKIKVRSEELQDFFTLIRHMPFGGISVTMPLKEAVMPFLDRIDPGAKQIGAVNTIVWEQGQLAGYNTDGIGALDAIEKQSCVKGKKIAILGAGGAAKAIAFQAKQRGAQVQIVNRDKDKARKLAENCGYSHGRLDTYDILINCTPCSMPVDYEDLLPKTHIMDIMTKPKATQILQEALKRNCKITYGYEMFVMQAAGQFGLWFEIKNNLQVMYEKLEENALKAL